MRVMRAQDGRCLWGIMEYERSERDVGHGAAQMSAGLGKDPGKFF